MSLSLAVFADDVERRDVTTAEAVEHPRAADDHSSVTILEGRAHEVIVDGRATIEQAIGVHAVEPLKGRHSAVAADTDIGRIPVPVRILTEDIAAKGRLNRIEVIGVVLLDQIAVLGAGIFDLLRERLHIIPRGRSFRDQIRVDEEADILDRVRQAVELAVEVTGRNAFRHEAVGLVAQRDLGQQTAVDQLANPVVGADQNVGAFAGRAGNLEVVADRAELLLDQFQTYAGVGLEFVTKRQQDRCAASSAGASVGAASSAGASVGAASAAGASVGAASSAAGAAGAAVGCPPPQAASTIVPMISTDNKSINLLRIELSF